jgi:hypothetical protein
MLVEILAFVERNISSRSDWLLAIAGGGFLALLSSGGIRPASVTLQTKELLVALSISSILGIIVKFYAAGIFQFITLSNADIDKLKEKFEKEIGDNPQQMQILRTALPGYLQSEALKILKTVFSARRFRKFERKLVERGKEQIASEGRILKRQLRRSYLLQAQFWFLFGGMLLHVVQVILDY